MPTPAAPSPARPVAGRASRSDARLNRDRILQAAASAFAEDGLGVSLIEIARRAGVGNATLHRNFTKDELIEELFEEWLTHRQAVAELAMADPDPWHGFVSFMEDVLADGTRNRAIGALLTVHPAWRSRATGVTSTLVARAQAAGVIRADLTAQDVVLALLSVSNIVAITATMSCEQWRRHLAILLDGMKAVHHDRLPGLSLTPDQLENQLCEWSAQLRCNGTS